MVEEKSQYISLQEATKYCDYSQEYLSLRIRQGKLKGIKFARNWVTKKEWLKEYLKDVRENNCNSVKNNFHCQCRENFISAEKKIPFISEKFFITQELVKEKSTQENQVFLRNFSGAIAVISILLIFYAGFFNPLVLQKKIRDELAMMSAQSVLQYSSEVFSKYGHWLNESITGQIVKVKTYIAYVLNPQKKILAENENKGMVVIPSTEDNEAIKEKIKNSFSDEVKVELIDEGSGIITPVFKERAGEKYLYIMVPVNN